MIPYADLERALARWKARQADPETSPVHEVQAEAVVESYSETMEHGYDSTGSVYPEGDGEVTRH